MRWSSAWTRLVSRSSAPRSPAVQAFSNTVTSPPAAASMAMPEKDYHEFGRFRRRLSACTGGGRKRMKLLVALTVMGAGTFACARGSGQRPDHLVMVCLNPGGNAAAFLRGEAVATQILKQANIRLQWRSAESNCSAGNGLVVTVSSS